jgi:hypothetical protein
MEQHLRKVVMSFYNIVSIMDGDYQMKADLVNQELHIIGDHLGHVCGQIKALETRVEELERKQRIGF